MGLIGTRKAYTLYKPAVVSTAYTAAAVELTASTDYMQNTSFSFGSPDYKKGIISLWVKFVTTVPGTGTGIIDLRTSGGSSQAYILVGSASNRLSYTVANSIMSYGSPADTIAADVWYWTAMSWDSSIQKSWACINDTVYTPTVPVLDNAISALGRVYLPQAGTVAQTMHLAEVYFAIGQYLDLSVQSNREKFRSAAGKPVSLGSDGSLPTGSAPTGYFRFLDPTNGTQANATGGSSLTVTGSLSAATAP